MSRNKRRTVAESAKRESKPVLWALVIMAIWIAVEVFL